MPYLLAIVFATIAFLLIVLARRPFYQKNLSLPQAEKYLQALLKRGRNGAFIIIEDMHSDKFVQFAKYIRKKGIIGLELSFPKAPWSEEYYNKLKEWLRNEKIPFIVQPVDSKPVSEFIDIDCEANVPMALQLLENIFKEIFQVKNPLLKIRGDNISPYDKLIDS